MSDYTKICEELRGRYMAFDCTGNHKYAQLFADAAAAIEELDAEETRLLLLTSDLQDKLMDLQEQLNDSDVAAEDDRRQIEKLAKRNAELHAELEKWVSAAEGLQAEVNQFELDNEDYEHEHRRLKGEIEALQAEVERLEPKQRKLGRWEKAKPKGVVTYSGGYAECSSCHEAIWLGWGMNFCPHCGVQNRIIDPDDIAKMEVQE